MTQGARFYLEATLATASNDKRAAEQRLGAIYDVLNRLDSPNFFLEVEVDAEGSAPPPTRRLRNDLVAWLSTLDPDVLLAEPDGRLTQTTAIEGHVGDGAGLRSAWADLPLTRQQAIVAAVLDRAIVRPAVRGRTRFDPDRIEPVWRL